MKKISVSSLLIGLLPLVLLTTACSSTPHENFTQNSFSNNSPYQRHVGASSTVACTAAERTLLGDGYTLDNTAKAGTVKGRKAYLMDSGRSSFLEMSVVCLPDATGSTIYANGLISKYDLKKSANAASVGVSVLGSISMPIGQSVDSMVKVSDETIRDRVFYKNFFAAVTAVLQDPSFEVAPPVITDSLVPRNQPPAAGMPLPKPQAAVDLPAPPVEPIPPAASTTEPANVELEKAFKGPANAAVTETPVLPPSSTPPSSPSEPSAAEAAAPVPAESIVPAPVTPVTQPPTEMTEPPVVP